MKKLITSLALALTALSGYAITPLWMRDARISPNGTEIVFCYKGDIYKVPAQGGTAVQLTTQAIKANPFGRSSEYLLGTSSVSRYFIQFRHCSGRKQSATCGVLNRCGEKYKLSVRSKSRRNLRSGMISQPLGGSAVSRHDKEVEIPINKIYIII